MCPGVANADNHHRTVEFTVMDLSRYDADVVDTCRSSKSPLQNRTKMDVFPTRPATRTRRREGTQFNATSCGRFKVQGWRPCVCVCVQTCVRAVAGDARKQQRQRQQETETGGQTAVSRGGKRQQCASMKSSLR